MAASQPGQRGSTSGRARSKRSRRKSMGTGSVRVIPLSPGHRVGRYVIRERLGAGGMGVVYAADDPELDRIVALKLLLTEGGAKAAARRKRLLREAQAMARLKHANVVGVLDVGVYDGRVFITMEYLEGARTLDDWIDEEEPSWTEILHAFMEAGEGLIAAHEAGLVHRDFKPGNVLVSADGHVRVTDFGLARRIDDPASEFGGSQLSFEIEGALTEGLTKTGAALGTPAYMAPEQHKSEPVDQRSDQFSFCVALFECLYGLPPFDGSDRDALADAVTRGRVRQPPWDTAVKPYIWPTVRRGLIADPRERFGSLRELLDALRRDPGQTYRRIAVWTGLGVVVLGGSVAGAAVLIPTEQVCGDGGEQLAGVWDDRRRGELAGVFARIETGYAPEAWTRVEAALDTYAEAWRQAHHRACLSTQEGSQAPDILDRRMACLDQRKRGLSAVVDVVATADAPSLTHAIGAVQRLPTLLPCEGGQAGTPSVRDDPESANTLHEAEGRVQKATALAAMGRFAEAQTEVEGALDVAQALDDAPLLARAAYERGRLATEQGDHATARQRLEQAFFAAQRGTEPGVAVDASADLARTIGVELGDPDAALEWIRHARAAMERLGPDTAREAAVLRALAEIHYARGDYEQAQMHASGGVALLEAHELPHDALLAESLETLGKTLAAQDRADEALAHYERVRVIRERLWGENHPRVGRALTKLGTIERATGRLDLALLHLHRAALVLERSLGPEHPSVAIPSIELAEVYGDRGEVAEALRYADRAVVLTQAAHGRDQLDTVLRRIERARLQLRLSDDYDSTAAELAACVRVLEADYADHAALDPALNDLAVAALRAGDTATASSVAQKALRRRGVLAQADDPTRAWLESVLAQAEWVQWADGGDQSAAVARMERALAVLQRSGPDWLDAAFEAATWLNDRRGPAGDASTESSPSSQ